MGRLHYALFRQAVATRRVDLGLGQTAQVFVDLERALEQRLETVLINGIQSLRQQVTGVVLCSTEPIVQFGAKGSGTAGAALTLRDKNTDVLNLSYSRLAHLSQHTGGA